jgi:hypothetical protein
LTAVTLAHSAAPGPGEASWFLVRAECCTGVGTYDSSSAALVESRDEKIQGSPNHCLQESMVNAVGNPSFENDTSGWGAYSGSTIVRRLGGYDGAFSLEMTGTATSDPFGVNDSPNWIGTTPAAGTHYRFRAWVRSASHNGAARLRIREYVGGSQVGAVSSVGITLSPAWQLLTQDYVSTAAGSFLDFQVLDSPATSYEVFETDMISIKLVE